MAPASWRYPRSPGRSAWLAGTSKPRERGRFARTSLLLASSAASGTTREAPSVPFSATSFRGSVFSREKIVFGKEERYATSFATSLFRVFHQRFFPSHFREPPAAPASEFVRSARHRRVQSRSCSLRRGRSESRAMNFVICDRSSISIRSDRSAATTVLFSRSASANARRRVFSAINSYYLLSSEVQ